MPEEGPLRAFRAGGSSTSSTEAEQGRMERPRHHLSGPQFFGDVSLWPDPPVEIFITTTMSLNI